jgi:hypothetical protein
MGDAAPELPAIGSRVIVTLRGKAIPAVVTGRIVTAKGMFHETTDAAGVVRKARAAHVALRDQSSDIDEGITPDAAPAIASSRVRRPNVTASATVGSGGVKIQHPAYGWPRGMREATAAEYVGLSASTLRGEVKAGRAVSVQLTAGRKVYLREELDAYLDTAAGRAPADTEGADEWMRSLG